MLRFLTSGASHRPGLVATLEGAPAVLTVTRDVPVGGVARARAGLGRTSEEHRLHLGVECGAETGAGDVPDPGCGGPGGFEGVLDRSEEGSRGLLDHIRANHL